MTEPAMARDGSPSACLAVQSTRLPNDNLPIAKT